jgi:hypothetical protein
MPMKEDRKQKKGMNSYSPYADELFGLQFYFFRIFKQLQLCSTGGPKCP